ncbi:MAG: hypothetical protein Q7R99_02655 [bacterium]|nr:hypothetical protein [bacterium]
MFKIFFREKSLKFLQKINRSQQLSINSALDNLSAEKFILLDIKKIKEAENGYRLRVGRWRILLTMFSTEKRIEIVDIFLKKSESDYQKRINLFK